MTVLKNGRGIRVRGIPRCKSVDIKTMPYPGFPTDIQPQMMSLMSWLRAHLLSWKTFLKIDSSMRMNCVVWVRLSPWRQSCCSQGVKTTGAEVEATDLRAGAALVLAGLAAEGVTVIHNIEHIDRGYHRLEEKYALLGANIKREKSNGSPCKRLEDRCETVVSQEIKSNALS